MTFLQALLMRRFTLPKLSATSNQSPEAPLHLCVTRIVAPYVLGNLTIDYAERRGSMAGRPVQMTAIEYRTLAELSSNAGRVLTYEHLLDGSGGLRPTPTFAPCAPR